MSRWRLLDAVLGRLTFCTCTHPGRRLTRPSVGLRGGPVRCLKIVTTSWVYRFSSRCSARSSRLASQGGHLGPKGARAPRSRAFKVCSVRIYYKSQESAANGSRNKPAGTSYGQSLQIQLYGLALNRGDPLPVAGPFRVTSYHLLGIGPHGRGTESSLHVHANI